MQFISPRRQILRYIGLTVLVILLIFLLVDLKALIKNLYLTDWREYFVSVVFLVAAYALITLRTQYLLQRKIRYSDALYVDASGFMFSILMQLPNSAYRALAMNRSIGVDGALTTSALTVEVMVGLLVRSLGLVFAIVLVAADSGDAQRPLLFSILVVIALFLLMFAAAKNSERIRPYLARGLAYLPRISLEKAEKYSESICRTLAHIASVRRFGFALFLTMMVWVMALLFYFYSFESMNIELTKPHLFAALAALIVAPPTSPMMIGIFHGTIIATLGTLGLMNPDDAAAYAVNLHFIQMLLLIIMGLIGIRRLKLEFRAIIKEIRSSARKQA